MLFRRRKPKADRTAVWQELAARLDMSPCIEGPALLNDSLDLDSTPLTGTVFRTERTGEVQIYAFDFLSDIRVPGKPEPFTGCLLVSAAPFCTVPLRMDRQLRSQLAGIQAGATQGQVVTTSSEDDFDERVTVVARDVESARQLLSGPVRSASLRLLERFETAPVLTANRRQLLAQVQADRFDLAGLEFLLSDLMTLYVALRETGSSE